MVKSLVVLGTDTRVLGVCLRSAAEQSNDTWVGGQGHPALMHCYPDHPF